jgi:hypothetical protein
MTQRGGFRGWGILSERGGSRQLAVVEAPASVHANPTRAVTPAGPFSRLIFQP